VLGERVITAMGSIGSTINDVLKEFMLIEWERDRNAGLSVYEGWN
jgi:hypothetical protein